MVSVGVNVAESDRLPACNTVPLAGLYTKAPGSFAVAFSCVGPKAVP